MGETGIDTMVGLGTNGGKPSQLGNERALGEVVRSRENRGVRRRF